MVQDLLHKLDQLPNHSVHGTLKLLYPSFTSGLVVVNFCLYPAPPQDIMIFCWCPFVYLAFQYSSEPLECCFFSIFFPWIPVVPFFLKKKILLFSAIFHVFRASFLQDPFLLCKGSRAFCFTFNPIFNDRLSVFSLEYVANLHILNY